MTVLQRLYNAQLIRREGSMRGVDRVELETLDWVDLFNNECPHEALDVIAQLEPKIHKTTCKRLAPTICARCAGCAGELLVDQRTERPAQPRTVFRSD